MVGTSHPSRCRTRWLRNYASSSEVTADGDGRCQSCPRGRSGGTEAVSAARTPRGRATVPSSNRNGQYERLLRVAAELFRVKGYAGTGIREIAAAFGTEVATIYYYVKSKADLLFEISQASLEE